MNNSTCGVGNVFAGRPCSSSFLFLLRSKTLRLNRPLRGVFALPSVWKDFRACNLNTVQYAVLLQGFVLVQQYTNRSTRHALYVFVSPVYLFFAPLRRAFSVLAILVLLFPVAPVATAAGKPLFQYSGSPLSRLFVDLQVGVQAVSYSDVDFNPTVTSIGAGLWLFENIGIDIFLDSAASDDREQAFTLEIDEASGFGLRL